MQRAFLGELAALVVVMLCCFVDPPLTWSAEGQVDLADDIQINAGGNANEYLAQPFALSPGDPVRIEYVDRLTEKIVLSVTVAPGKPGSAAHTTQSGQRFHQWLWLSYLALLGLVAGLAVAVLAAVRLYALARRQGTPTGGFTAALAPFSLLGSVQLLVYVFSLPGNRVVIYASTVVWILAAIGALSAGALPRLPGEVHVAVGRLGQALVGSTSALWILGWIAVFLWALHQFGTMKF